MLDVRLRNRRRIAGQLYGVVAKRTIHFVELGPGVIRLDLRHPLVVANLRPEVISMSFNSVVAAVGLGHDDCEHLALSPGERRIPVHDRQV